MMKTNPEDKAFPISATAAKQIAEGYGFPDEYLGLTKREYFAVMAMQGLIANAPINNLGNSAEGVQLAVKWTDDLIQELNHAE